MCLWGFKVTSHLFLSSRSLTKVWHRAQPLWQAPTRIFGGEKRQKANKVLRCQRMNMNKTLNNVRISIVSSLAEGGASVQNCKRPSSFFWTPLSISCTRSRQRAVNVLSLNIKHGIQRSICSSLNFIFYLFFITAYVMSPQALNSMSVHQARVICIQPFHHWVRLKSDNKQHMRREDFDTADQRQPHLCSPRQICLLMSFHPVEGLRWLTSVAAHPGQRRDSSRGSER